MTWAARAEQAQQALDKWYWNEAIGMYDIEIPCPDGSCNTIFHYWWMAHAADALVDGLKRTGDERYRERLSALYDGLLKRNGGAWPNELYDDMEWMAIAWLRAYEATGEARFREAALLLWQDIQTGWNGTMGGGIAWHKEQLGYKNTPANAPAAILAARLHRMFGREEDLRWAERIYGWLKSRLVDEESGFVWDGMNRQGDGAIDKDWKFTYCQGVFIGAGVELFRETGQAAYLEDALRTARAAERELARPGRGILPDEGEVDGGLFKGIYVRYAGELAAECRRLQETEAGKAFLQAAASGEAESAGAAGPAALLELNAVRLWDEARDPARDVFHHDWTAPPPEKVTLSTQLSAVMLLEQMAAWEALGPPHAGERRAADSASDEWESAGPPAPGEASEGEWGRKADQVQLELRRLFWNAELGVMNHLSPSPGEEPWIYWWHAHALDALADRYCRTGDGEDLSRIDQAFEGAVSGNGGTTLHNYYDDMEWMALALHRIGERTGQERYLLEARKLWEDIKTAWNGHMGGGMAWKKDQLDYKNTPANAPAAILAARLYRTGGMAEDLEWAERIYAYAKSVLVDPESGFVWDGINRQGDGKIDYDWRYTYCQGVFIGAGLELYRCTGDEGYRLDALRTAEAARRAFVDPATGLLPDEGPDDCGLFKGILCRYAAELVRAFPREAGYWADILQRNAESLWSRGRDGQGRISLSWAAPPELPVQLSGQLSGVMLVEAAALLEREGLLPARP